MAGANVTPPPVRRIVAYRDEGSLPEILFWSLAAGTTRVISLLQRLEVPRPRVILAEHADDFDCPTSQVSEHAEKDQTCLNFLSSS
jgi:hypothetical protein